MNYKASKLVEDLHNLIDQYGDLPIAVSTPDYKNGGSNCFFADDINLDHILSSGAGGLVVLKTECFMIKVKP